MTKNIRKIVKQDNRGNLPIETIELIYHFAKSSWGKGYATEAAAACINFAKANGNVKTIYASADTQNADSLKILEKVGFEYKGLKFLSIQNKKSLIKKSF